METKRNAKILQLLTEHGYISVKELCKLLYVSEPTIRRNLAKLEKEGLIRRSHGGACPISNDLWAPLPFCCSSMQGAKKRIAQAAAPLIEDDSIILIDTSTTAMSLIPLLRKKKNITVITNGLPALNLLQAYHIKAKCTGGDLKTESMGFVGPQAQRFVSMLHADWMFFSPPCVSTLGEITDHSEEETYLRMAMLDSSKQSVFMFDQSKYGKIATFQVSDFDHVDYVITNMDAALFSHFRCKTISAQSSLNTT